MEKEQKVGVVITSIYGKTPAVIELENGCRESTNHTLYIAGDTLSIDADYFTETKFLSIADQLETGFKYARLAPVRNYCRKNIGYLSAWSDGVDYIVETDDDNFPREGFFDIHSRTMSARISSGVNFVNAYEFFVDATDATLPMIWPRGFPIEYSMVSNLADLPSIVDEFPVQSFLVDNDPDVDALYRLMGKIPFNFSSNSKPLALDKGTWCSFNTQNTVFFRTHAALMYQPATPQFREADIIRSYITQRILWEMDERILFRGPTVYQERNEHDLMDDLRQETGLYSWASQLCLDLERVVLTGGMDNLPDDYQRCLDVTQRYGFTKPEERKLHMAWCEDMNNMGLL